MNLLHSAVDILSTEFSIIAEKQSVKKFAACSFIVGGTYPSSLGELHCDKVFKSGMVQFSLLSDSLEVIMLRAEKDSFGHEFVMIPAFGSPHASVYALDGYVTGTEESLSAQYPNKVFVAL